MPDDPASWGYFDTSALVKAYIEEPGTRSVLTLLEDHPPLSSALAPIELASALGRRRAAAEITKGQIKLLLSRIDEEREYWTLIAVDAHILAKAESLCRRTVSLRTLDAIHVASALFFQESSGLRIPFITADARQGDAATKLGLNVVGIS